MSARPIPVRQLGAGDWELLRELRLAALREAPYAFASTFERERDDTPEQWRERLERLVWFVAGTEPAGLVAGAPPSEAMPGTRHLLSMWVSPAHRGQGIAGALIAAVREWAVADGADGVALWVADGNDAAIRTYTKAGFAPTGRRQPLPSDPDVPEELWLLTLP